MAYVPPWKKAQVDGAPPPQVDGVPPRSLEALIAQTPLVSTFTLGELERTVGRKQGTLTAFTHNRECSDSPPQSLPESPIPPHPLEHLICYVTLFHGAHPDWPHTLWFHTNAELLDNDLNIGRPLPCIKQVNVGLRRAPEFKFDSWIKITVVRKLDPVNDKEELVDLLKRKEQGGTYRRGRFPGVWKGALDTTWVKASIVPVAGFENPFKPLNEDSLRYLVDRAEEYVQNVTATPM